MCVCVKTEGSKICFGELSSTEKVLIINAMQSVRKWENPRLEAQKTKQK